MSEANAQTTTQTKTNTPLRQSIAAATLRSAAIRIAIIILVATAIAYVHFFSSIKDRHLNELAEFGRERGERELSMFQLAEDNLQVVRQEIESRLDRVTQREVDARFEQIAPRYPDGTRRSPKVEFDLETTAQIWIARTAQLTESGRRQVVVAHDLLSRYGPAWRNRFPDVYLIGAEDFVVNYWYKEPFVFNIASDFSFLKESYYRIGLPENNPAKTNKWTPVYLDPTVKKWMVSSITPQYHRERFIGVIGHDVYLDDLINRTINDRPDGATNILLSRDGYLIAHPRYMSQIEKASGNFQLSKEGDADLKGLYALLKSRGSSAEKQRSFVLEDDAFDRYLVVTHLPQPDWFLVTEYPKKLVAENAFQSARLVLILGALSLLLEVVMLFVVIRQMVARPLDTLGQATREWTRAGSEKLLDQHIPRGDEIGQLARDFANMRKVINDQFGQLRSEIAERESAQAALQSAQADLEEKVRLATNDLQAANAQLTRIALYDSLTGLPNRKHYEQKLTDVLQSDARQRCTIMLIDLDGFKAVNDTLGHAAGDQLLVAIAQRLTRCLRDNDIVARLGGDEFAVLIVRSVTHEMLAAIGVRIVQACSQPVDLTVRSVVVSASVGIAQMDDTLCALDWREVFTRIQQYADLAMYHAKGRGKKEHVFFSQDLAREALRLRAMTQALSEAVLSGQLVAHFQPIHDGQSRAVTGLEALVSWQHPTEGLLPPQAFLPLAEQSGAIAQIDLWMFEQSCALIREHRDRLPAGARVSVNVAPGTLANEDLVERVSALLAASGVSAGELAIEITERSFLEDGPAVKTLSALSNLGFALILDDFGTGYSALAHLKRLPLAGVKLDRTFVHDLVENRHSQAIVSSLITMTRQLGMHMVAEGVETEAQLRFLQRAGCDQVQGFLLSAPVDTERLLALLPQTTIAAKTTA